MLMGKAIFAAILTLFAWYMAMLYGSTSNFPELGNLAAVIVMGACIIYYNDEKKRS